jgi:hypothetical protein
MANRGGSQVWEYFTKGPSNTITCNICTASVSQGSGSLKFKNTSNLWAHLKSKHQDIYHKAQKDAQPQVQLPTTSLTQPTLKQVMEKTK